MNSSPSVRSHLQPQVVDTISMLSTQIKFVQKHIEKVNKNRDNQMENIENTKRKLKHAAGRGMPAALLEQHIQDMMVNHTHLLDEVNQLTAEAVKDKKSIDIINEAITLMDREVARIQNEHDIGILDLQEKREKLKNKLHSILEVDEMIADVEVKIAYEMEQYRLELETVEEARDKLNKREDFDTEDVKSQIKVVQLQIEELSRKYKQDIEFLQKQKKDIEVESAAILQNLNESMKDLFVGGTEDYLEEIKRFEELKLHASPSKQSALDRAILFYQSRITQEELKQNITLADRINAFLKENGLVLTEDGDILYEDGKVLTRQLAEENGLLLALDKYLVESYGLHFIDINKVLTNSGEVLTREQAHKMELLEKYDLAAMLFAEESIRSDLSSRDSEFMSEDAFYLKKYLGIPLTLALAEITAKQPRDPIHYLGHWLFKYRYNQEVDQTKKLEGQLLTNMRNTIAKEKWTHFLEEEARKTVLEVVQRAESQGDKNEFERELQRISDETEAMENEEDQDALEEEARDTLGEYKGPTVNQRGSK